MRLIWMRSIMPILKEAMMRTLSWNCPMFPLLLKLVTSLTTQLKLMPSLLILVSSFNLLGGSRTVFNNNVVILLKARCQWFIFGDSFRMLVTSRRRWRLTVAYKRQKLSNLSTKKNKEIVLVIFLKTNWKTSTHTSKNSSFSLNEKQGRSLMGRRRSSTQMLYWQSSNTINL